MLYETNSEYRNLKDIYDNAYLTRQAKIVMLGDSITYNINWNELLDNNQIVNRGIGSDITEGFLNRLNNIIKLNPEKVFIMGGINDIEKGLQVKDIYRNLIKIIQKLQNNNIQPVIQSVLYTAESAYTDKVRLLNKKLREYSVDNNIIFIDLNKYLSKNGKLIQYYSTDGVHLNARGYNIWRVQLKKYINSF